MSSFFLLDQTSSHDTVDCVPSIADVSRADAEVEMAIEAQKAVSESPTSTYDRHRGEFLSEQERLDDTHFYQQSAKPSTRWR